MYMYMCIYIYIYVYVYVGKEFSMCTVYTKQHTTLSLEKKLDTYPVILLLETHPKRKKF